MVKKSLDIKKALSHINESPGKLPHKFLAEFTAIFYDRTGINLGEHKRYLFETRLAKLFQANPDLKGWKDLHYRLTARKESVLMTDFINLLVTNYSYFLRDPVHFRFLKYYLVHHYNPKNDLRIWSAASAKGEEAYSIVFTILSTLRNPEPAKIKILATDISKDVLQKGIAGEYKKSLIAGKIDEKIMYEYFDYPDSEVLRVKDRVKQYVVFRQHNLLEKYPGNRKFNIIFLRNMLIYLSTREKEMVLERMAEQLEPDGYLILGNSETVVNLKQPFVNINHNIFRLK